MTGEDEAKVGSPTAATKLSTIRAVPAVPRLSEQHTVAPSMYFKLGARSMITCIKAYIYIYTHLQWICYFMCIYIFNSHIYIYPILIYIESIWLSTLMICMLLSFCVLLFAVASHSDIPRPAVSPRTGTSRSALSPAGWWSCVRHAGLGSSHKSTVLGHAQNLSWFGFMVYIASSI